MPPQQETALCHYQYDPLDRLTSQTQTEEPTLQRFYREGRLSTEIKGAIKHSIFQLNDQLLAQQQQSGDTPETTLLATDLQRSVLQALKSDHRQPIAYSPYGHRPAENGLTSLLGFNGERPDPVTGHYLLGNGYRAFNPVLMRFNSSDNLSPFGKGGLNSYAYCIGSPMEFRDPSGHAPIPLLTPIRHLAPSPLLPPLPPLPSIPRHTVFLKKNHFHYGENLPRIRKNSAPSPSAKALPDEPSNLDFIGYHGSSREAADSLSKGLNPKLMGSKHMLLGGRGFYTTPNYEVAVGYAKTLGKNDTPQIYSIYTPNFQALKQGTDYRFGAQAFYPLERKNLELIIKQPAYKKITVKMFDIREVAVQPKSYEAPF